MLRKVIHWRRLPDVIVVLAAMVMAAVFTAGSAAAADIQVVVTNLRSTKGTVHFALYDSPETFPKKGKMLEERTAPASAPVTTFSGFKPGTYAVAVYHDENDNDEFDQGLLGIPLEGYAFSMGARVFLGPPSFADAAFDVPANGIKITIPMTYW